MTLAEGSNAGAVGRDSVHWGSVVIVTLLSVLTGKFCLLACFLPVARYHCHLLSKCLPTFPPPLPLSLLLLLLSPLLLSHTTVCGSSQFVHEALLLLSVYVI